MKISDLYTLYQENPKIVIDSRKAGPGSIFVGLQGDNLDGNAFASQAIEKGCTLAIIDNKLYNKNSKDYVLTENSLKTLQELAKWHRQHIDCKIIGITGTNGKTTTKELVSEVLSTKYKTQSTVGNLNNHIGVPLTLLALSQKTEMAVVEMGANHQGEIELLCDIARPDYGIITNIGKAHLEGFGGFEGVIKTKGELYRFIKNSNGKIFINIDNSILNDLSQGLDKLPYSFEKPSSCKGKIHSSIPFLSILWTGKKGTGSIDSKLTGIYNAENILCAVCVGQAFDIEPELMKESIESYRPSNNRSQMIQTETNEV
ncbi:MAG: UDP-N-acetylmuramoyl-tripeptide--D-alanyl-D-alanine ligase, partial [Bacteroidales bacterium]|nr:UDP-N-acetylmuramoyl-tripeptide--D-alanyl-D-alanine ligase [Bacteroidales bacterium]